MAKLSKVKPTIVKLFMAKLAIIKLNMVKK